MKVRVFFGGWGRVILRFGVLSEKPWRWDAILLLLAVICLTIGAGGALVWLFQEYGPPGEREQRFLRFVVGTLTLQSAGLVFVHMFIDWHGLSWRDFLGIRTRPVGWVIVWAVAMSVFAIPATILLNTFTGWLISQFREVPEPQAVMVVLQESHRLSERMALGFTAIVLAPVFEESIFRGILYPAIKNAGYPTLALAGTSLLFGAIHASLLIFLPLTFLGIMFAILYEKTDSLLAPIIGHSLFNAVNFAYAILVAGKTTTTTI